MRRCGGWVSRSALPRRQSLMQIGLGAMCMWSANSRSPPVPRV